MRRFIINIAICLFFGILFFSPKEPVNAYVCPANYYCETQGGSLVLWYGAGESCYDILRRWTCTGTDANCNGTITASGYPSKEACVAGTGWYTYSAGCCNYDSTPCTSTCSSNCNPGACPAGYTKDSTLTACRAPNTTTVSCTNSGSSCPPSAGCGGESDTCYLLETNLAPTSTPASITMNIDGNVKTLSTDPANPTVIHLPCAATDGTYNVTLSLPSFTPPTTSDGGGYYFKANNYGLNDEWKVWVDCSGTVGEDFCTTSTTRTIPFDPSTKSVPFVLKEGAEGKISGMYYTVNKCNTTKLYSTARVGYYIVESHDPTTEVPTNTILTIDSIAYTLTSNSVSPVVVKIPSSDTAGTVTLQIPWIALPAGSDTRGYYFRGYNDGVDNEWAASTTCASGGVAGEDFCLESTSRTQNFEPFTKTITQVLKDSADGRISSRYYTTNRCGLDKEYGSYYTTYYKVDSLPETPPPFIPDNILPDIGTDLTAKQCSSTTYTGQEINNPLHFNVGVTDDNGISDIQGLIVWFSKDTTVPATMIMSGINPNADISNDIGVFLRKNGATWGTPIMYGYDNVTNSWQSTTTGVIRNSSAEISVKIEDTNVSTDATTATFDFKLEFLDTTIDPQGLYNLYLTGVDSFMINGTTVDQSNLTRYFNWGIDLDDPTNNDITKTIFDATNVRMTWGVADSISGISKTVINAYRVGGQITSQVKLYLPVAYTVNKGNVTLNPTPVESEIGMYNDTNSWRFTGVQSTGETDQMSIGENEGGSIDIYVSTFDKACNTNTKNEDVDLNAWFATRGGAVYSKENISSTAKDVSTATNLDNVFNTKSAMVKEKIDIGTELLATRNNIITNLIHSASGAVRATLLFDSNNIKNTWFNTLVTTFNKYISDSMSFAVSPGDLRVSTKCTAASCYSYPRDTSISIPADYICDKPTLFISDNDINIEPNITSGTGIKGCIFLAKNNIVIGEGAYKSTGTKIMYDFIEGFFIAENQIIFPLADTSKTLRDGVEILGGLTALGSNVSTGTDAISIGRNMRLFNQTNPTIVATYDNKYADIASKFFGTEVPIYRQEVGFKSF